MHMFVSCPATSQGNHQCWCGDSYGKHGMEPEQSQCNRPCCGDTEETCGNDYMNFIYSSGKNPLITQLHVSRGTKTPGPDIINDLDLASRCVIPPFVC